jgi:glycosyltransferase involved in cell wall biosynthesis
MDPYHPKVSIITVCLNSKEYIEDTIRSVRGQTYKDIEYIIIDGGSTDGTITVIKKYEKDISYWVSEPDKGISDAFNKGINASKGDIIGIINAGDRYTVDAVSTAVRILKENPEFDFVYGDLIYTDEKGNPQFLVKGDRNYQKKIYYTLPSLIHPTVFLKRDVYESCGLYEGSYRLAMDYEFLLRITRYGKKGIYVEDTLALMTFGGISYSKFYDSYKEVCRASIKYGYSPIKAYLRLYLKGIRGFVRVGLEAVGLNSVVRQLRKIFWSVEDLRTTKPE